MLLPDWNEMYRLGTPPWETGRPAPELVRVVEALKLRPCAVLELGCGSGSNAIWLSKKRYEVTAVDSAPLAIERARLRCEQQNGLVRFLLNDVFDVSKSLGRFDFVFDVGFYHFIRQAELERFLDMLWWVTKPGSLYLTLAGAAGEVVEGGPPQVTEDQVRTELGRLFETVEIRPFRFESSTRPEGFLGWSCLMRRPEMPKA